MKTSDKTFEANCSTVYRLYEVTSVKTQAGTGVPVTPLMDGATTSH